MIQRKRPDNKEKGVLLPVFSLPSKYGIGCFSKEAYDFIQRLAQTGHTYWQILPLNPTGVADSPYQPLSSFAGNAYFIDPVQLMEQGLVTEEELAGFDFGSDPSRADYEVLYDSRMEMLRLAYERFASQRLAGSASGSAGADDAYADAGSAACASADPDPLERFASDNAFWLEDYSLFMALRDKYGRDESWDEWPEDLRRRSPEALFKAAEELRDEITFYQWTQYEFYRQWGELKQYANNAGIRIIGDMPVYVSYDSSDCWADPDQFQLDEDLQPTRIAGVPPDDFAEEGQLWGNPLYDWEKMRLQGYDWWISRIRQSFLLYDVIRLDHFRGYEAYFSVAADAENAIGGTWTKGPGIDLFRQLAEAFQVRADSLKDCFIAEDLGFLTEDVHLLLRECGFPGTKVIQFAFDGDPQNMYLPENYQENCVVYTGTHDNDTTAGWFRSLGDEAQAGILQYLGLSAEQAWYLILEWAHAGTLPEEEAAEIKRARNLQDPAIVAAEGMMRKALDSCAKIAIIPLQDYLLLGSEARVNVPGTVGGNWCWRVQEGML